MPHFSENLAVVFDFDGTLGLAAEHRGSPDWILRVIQRDLPKGVCPLVKPPIRPETSDFDFVEKQIVNKYQKTVLTSLLENNITMVDRGLESPPDLEAILHFLSTRYSLFIYSGRDQTSLLHACSALNISQYFKEIVGAIRGIPSKPAPEQIASLVKSHNVSLNMVVYVGDTETDLHLVNNARCNFIQAAWLHDRFQISHEWPICHHFSQLEVFLDEIFSNNSETLEPISGQP